MIEKPYAENEALLQAVLRDPDTDEPREVYARWCASAADSHNPGWAEFIRFQLQSARRVRADRRVRHVDLSDRPAMGDHFTPQALELRQFPLRSIRGGFSELSFHRGFIEHVAMVASRFADVAPELFARIPLRFVSLEGAQAGLASFAASPYAQRIRSLTLPLTDELIDVLVASPNFRKLACITSPASAELTTKGLQRLVTAPSLPGLSVLRIDEDPLPHWREPVAAVAHPWERNVWAERIRSLSTPRDTPNGVTLYPSRWIAELEATLGYVPCVHPERFYGRYSVEPERVALSPIAEDARVMQLKGAPVPDPGPKPSLVERWEQGLCPLCGTKVEEQPLEDPYSGLRAEYPDQYLAVCPHCGTEYWLKLWPEAQTSGRQHGAS